MSPIGGNAVDKFSILDDVDDAGIHVADVDGIVGSDGDPAARGERPGLDEFTLFVEDRNALVVTVVHEDPALRIQGNAVRYLKLSGLPAFHAADDSDKLSVTGEVHDP